jgi:chemotaxis protein methyltransferase CheR
MAAPKPDSWEQALRAANGEQWSEALRWLADAEKEIRLRPEIHYLRGVIELQRGDPDQALVSLRRAIYCDENFVLAHYALGELYQSQGNYRKASYQWNQALLSLETFQPNSLLPFSDDLTAEMLSGLLHYRLDNLPLR